MDEKVTLRVLLKNKRTCCVCHDPDKAIQVHHINGDRSHTVQNNLAVLCFTHHDQATAGLKKGPVGLGVKLSPSEVRAHKSAWEASVADEYKVQRKALPQSKRKQIALLFEFELVKVKNEIFSSRRASTITARLKYVVEFLIEEFVTGIPFRKLILEAFSDIAIRAAGDDKIAVPLIRAIPRLHLHLVGPHEVKLSHADKSALQESIDILETLGTYAMSFGSGRRGVPEACTVILELTEIATWYGLTELVDKVEAILKKMHSEKDDLTPREQRTKKAKSNLKCVEQALNSVHAKRERLRQIGSNK